MNRLQDIAIRVATVEDAQRVSAFAARTFSETFAADNAAADMAMHLAATYTPELQRGELERPDVRTVLAELDGELAAYAQLARHDAPACVTGASPVELARFYVDRAMHGRGLAQAMMQRAIDEAVRMGACTLWLGVWERNPRAIAFYGKMGFEDVGSHDFVLGRDVQTDRVMQRAIGAHAPRADG